MQRRTCVMVSRASTRAFAAPARNVARTPLGSARSACARSRTGASAAIILSASTRLQSRQPQPAVRQLCATRAWVSGLEKPWWMVKMLQMSGLPGSFRVTRAGSVAAGLSFSQMVSGESSKPMVLPKLLDIFAWPSSPKTRFAVDSSACGSGKAKPPLFEAGIPAARNLAHQLEVLELVLADRNERGPVEQYVSGLEHGVIEQPRRHARLALRFILELRLALELTERRHGVEQPVELGMLGDVRLHEHDRVLRV